MADALTPPARAGTTSLATSIALPAVSLVRAAHGLGEQMGLLPADRFVRVETDR